MKPEKQPADDKLEKELKRMKRKLDNENIALNKILTGSKPFNQDAPISKNTKPKKKDPGIDTGINYKSDV
ncbi:MAG: hypothetical protein HOO86_00535 [Bacteroidales bacterium]|nr:hypothetical protein [Bacteroidales bacterium]